MGVVLSKAVHFNSCFASLRQLQASRCREGAGAERGWWEQGARCGRCIPRPASHILHPAGGLRKEPRASAPGGSASRHPPCPRPYPRSPGPLQVWFHNQPAPVYSGSVSPWKINCVCVFSSPLVLLQGRERGRDSARCYTVGWLGKQHPRSSGCNCTFS